MRAFVTGGSGFIGQRLIRALKEQGGTIRALARSPQATQAVGAAGAEPVPGDLEQVAAMQEGMKGCDVVFHAAARLRGVRRSDFILDNVRGTENVLEAARGAGVRRLVYVSAEAVLLGSGPLANVDETRPLPGEAIGAYAVSKARAEAQVLACNSPGMQTVAVRPRLVWGTGDTGLLPGLVERVRRGRFAWIDGGHHLTSTCHVDNAVEGLLLAAERGQGGQAYFVTDGPPVELREFFTQLLATQGVKAPRRSLPLGLAAPVAWGGDALWSMLRLEGSPRLSREALLLEGWEVTVRDDKARRDLGYAGKRSRESGLEELRREAAPARPT